MKTKFLALLTCVASISVATTESLAQTIFLADFDNDVPGMLPDFSLPGGPSGDSFSISGNPGIVEVVPNTNGVIPSQALRLQTGGVPQQIFVQGTPDAAGAPFLSGQYELSWTSANLVFPPGEASLIGITNGSNFTFALLHWPDGTFRVTAAPSGFTAIGGIWGANQAQDFRIVIDFDTDTADVFIDEVQVGAALPLRNGGSVSAFVTITIPNTVDFLIDDLRLEKVEDDPVVDVEIDIKPGSDPNCFNINGHGVIPVAINGSETFSIHDIDITSVSFAGLDVRVRGNKGPLCSVEDWNGDAFDDLVCHFEDDASNWNAADDSALLTGQLYDGTAFEGSDSICVVPN